MQPFPIRKLANAFIPGAAPSQAVSRPALRTLSRFSRDHGGLWVGGLVDISQDGVSFTANGLNRALHVGLEPVVVPAGSVRSVRREFGWVTGIIVVGHQSGEFRFRCFGAGQVAAAMSFHYAVP